MQLSRIERRERRIHMIREKLDSVHHTERLEGLVDDCQVQYNVGKTQNSPVHVPSFIQRNHDDPAIKVSLHLSLILLAFHLIAI
jgi:hypothetical protein